MLQPTVRRTWAPRGQTPLLRGYDRRDRITAVSAVTLSPRRRRLGLHFDLLDHNMKAEDFELLIVRLLRKVRGWGRSSSTGSVPTAVRQLGCAPATPGDSASSGCRPTRRSSTRPSKYGTTQSMADSRTSSPITSTISEEPPPRSSGGSTVTKHSSGPSSSRRDWLSEALNGLFKGQEGGAGQSAPPSVPPTTAAGNPTILSASISLSSALHRNKDKAGVSHIMCTEGDGI